LSSLNSDSKVSVVIPAYNAERTIGDAIESVLAQNCDSSEVIVVNDGSTDSTADILERYRGLIRVVNQPNRGPSTARNAGVAQARGKYVAFLDSDDLWLPSKLDTMVAALEQRPSATLAFSEYSIFSTAGAEYGNSSLGHAPSRQELMEQSLPPILTSTWVLPKRSFEQSGGFSEALADSSGQGFEDSWLLLILSEIGEFIYVPEVLTRYRIYENVESADKYGRRLSTFLSLAKGRYGRSGKPLVRNAKELQCRFLRSKMAHQIDRGERWAVLSTFARIAKLQPAYLLGPEFMGRLRLPQNTKRIRRLLTGQTGRAMRARDHRQI
jgi:glycosyltransferase involved in cell wall biosynthesis